MEKNKQPQKDVHRKRAVFFHLGLIMSLLFVMTAFEWRFYDDFEQIDLTVEATPTFILEPPTIIEETKEMPKSISKDPVIVESEDENKKIEEIIEDLISTDTSKPTDKHSTKMPTFNHTQIVEPKDDGGIFLIVEEQPEPEGGIKSFYKYLSKNIQYPRLARRQGIVGKVFMHFVVGKDGTLTDIKVLKGIGGGCYEEAIRVLKNAPTWKPGKQRGRAVRVQMSIPISFNLN